MKKLILLAAMLGCLVFAGSASAYSYVFFGTIPNGLDATTIENSFVFQNNVETHAHWSNVDNVTFGGSGAIPILIGTDAQVAANCGPNAAGCHIENAGGSGNQIWVVNHSNTGQPWTGIVSHEIIENQIDRYYVSNPTCVGPWLGEAADPVYALYYLLAGTQVSDFVYPRWYQAGTSGPWDWENFTTSTFDYSYGVPPQACHAYGGARAHTAGAGPHRVGSRILYPPAFVSHR